MIATVAKLAPRSASGHPTYSSEPRRELNITVRRGRHLAVTRLPLPDSGRLGVSRGCSHGGGCPESLEGPVFPGCEGIPRSFLLSGRSRFDSWRGHRPGSLVFKLFLGSAVARGKRHPRCLSPAAAHCCPISAPNERFQTLLCGTVAARREPDIEGARDPRAAQTSRDVAAGGRSYVHRRRRLRLLVNAGLGSSEARFDASTAVASRL
jgi:hypothetical protein